MQPWFDAQREKSGMLVAMCVAPQMLHSQSRGVMDTGSFIDNSFVQCKAVVNDNL